MRRNEAQPSSWTQSKTRQLKRWLQRRRRLLTYLPLVLILVVILLTSKDYSIIAYIQHSSRMRQVEQQYQHYRTRYQADSARLSEIRTSASQVEHIAREQYYMRTPGEEIFVIASPEALQDSTQQLRH